LKTHTAVFKYHLEIWWFYYFLIKITKLKLSAPRPWGGIYQHSFEKICNQSDYIFLYFFLFKVPFLSQQSRLSIYFKAPAEGLVLLLLLVFTQKSGKLRDAKQS
jgi:hypothetical protein